MKASVQPGEDRQPVTSLVSLQTVPYNVGGNPWPSDRKAPTAPRQGRCSSSTLIAINNDGGLTRVRVGQSKQNNTMVLLENKSTPMLIVKTRYLDGYEHTLSVAGSYYQEDEVSVDVVPATTKDITDFGRLTVAASNLASSMAAYDADNPPSPTQLAVFVNGYRNLLAWQRKARQKMDEAEGRIEAVEAMLTPML